MASSSAPFALYAAYFAQAVPAAALLARKNRSRPVVLIAATFFLTFIGDTVGHYIGRVTGNSLWVGALSELILGPVTLWAIAEWQVTYVERLMVRISVVPFMLIYGGLTLFVEDLTNFPKYTSPFLAVLTLGAAAWTLLRRSMTNIDTPILRTDWFWVLGGLALASATTAVTTPIGAILITEKRYDLFFQVWTWRACFSIVGFVAVTIGTLLPSAQENSA